MPHVSRLFSCCFLRAYFIFFFSTVLNMNQRKFFGKTSTAFGEINPEHDRFWESVESLNKFAKKSWGNIIVGKFLQDLYFYTQREDGAYALSKETFGGCPRGVMVKVMDCEIVVSEFEFQSRYYVHFRANTLGKGMNSLILPAMV